MPPRFVYWTILIDGKPTAFRARDIQELLPTVNQLKRTNTDVVVKWFARGRLWDSPEAERAAQYPPAPPAERRSRDWRPGGAHKDPRDRFKKKNRPERAWSEADRDRKPWSNKPLGAPQSDRPVPHRSSSDRHPSGRAWENRPPEPPRADRPWRPKPGGEGRPARQGPKDRPWQTKPTGPRKDRKPWRPNDRSQGARGWQGKPRDQKGGRPPFRRDRPQFPRKKRDDEPDKN